MYSVLQSLLTFKDYLHTHTYLYIKNKIMIIMLPNDILKIIQFIVYQVEQNFALFNIKFCMRHPVRIELTNQ